ncbi:MAG TPA: hypothetical protein VM184_06830, partial [Gaiellaceae bacterium]|nr:hypothetical protein [Gaiellaceae bacterium]
MAIRRATRTVERPAKPARAKPPAKKRGRSPRATIVLRWCVLGVLALVGVLYYQPLSSYVETRSALNERA